VVVIDVDRQGRGVDDAGLGADTVPARAVDGDENALPEVGRARSRQALLLQVQEPVLAG
jgi:hypothetical protein